MSTKTYLAKATLSAAGVVVLMAVAFALIGQSGTTRSERLHATATEIGRGNYFAWVQARSWSSRLTPEEKRLLQKACGEYSGTNAVLHARGNRWTPEQSNVSWRMQALVCWLRNCLGVRDHSLHYDVISFPAFYELPVAPFDTIFERQQPESQPVGCSHKRGSKSIFFGKKERTA